ncbi:MAG: TonB-dependent receptor [Candidatus Competibacteraceae bacterium]|nr:TonB-dependent receptor [Candidatus Competibacteraceae bacterium]
MIASYVNADSARIQGLELEGSWRIAQPWSLFANANYYFTRTEELGGQSQDILNVPRTTIRAGVDYEWGPWSAGTWRARRSLSTPPSQSPTCMAVTASRKRTGSPWTCQTSSIKTITREGVITCLVVLSS